MSKSKSEWGGGYSKSDAARDTGASGKQVSEAHHEAKDAAAKEGGWGVPSDRHGSSDKGSDDSGK